MAEQSINKRQKTGANAVMWLKTLLERPTAANLLMFSFILFTSIGCFLIYVPAGFITAGVACGVFGFLLGQE